MRKIMYVGLLSLSALTRTMLAGAQTRVSDGGHAPDRLPRMRDSVLLVGYGPDSLFLTTANETHNVSSGRARIENLFGSITPSGRFFASVRVTESDEAFAITAPIKDGVPEKAEDHPNFEVSAGQIAISPDSSKLACFRYAAASHSWELQVLDLQSSRVDIIRGWKREPGFDIAWSPDERHLAVGIKPDAQPSEIESIYVIDTFTRSINRLVTGHSPAWSPSGEWIAFVGYLPSEKPHGDTWCDVRQCYIPGADLVQRIRPDGSDSQVLMKVKTSVFGHAPVWSPDSMELLVDKSRNTEIDSYDIYLIELKSGKRSRLFKNTMPVWGWGSEVH